MNDQIGVRKEFIIMGISRNSDGSLSLTADWLPSGVWGSNLRVILPRPRWEELSRRTAERAGRLCEVCRQPSRYGHKTRNPDCHEIWSFNDAGGAAVQRLVGVVALCGACHETQHSGLAEVNGRGEFVVETLMRVNDWSSDEAEADIEDSVKRWGRLTTVDWALDLAALDGWLTLEGFSSLVVGAEARAILGNTIDGLPRKLSVVVGGHIPEAVWTW